MISRKDLLVGLVVCLALASAKATAQDDPFADEPADDENEAAPPAEAAPSAEPEAPAEVEPVAEPTPEPSEPESAATGAAEGGASADTSIGLSATTAPVDGAAVAPTSPTPGKAPITTGSHIRRRTALVEGTPVVPSPLRTDIQGREYMQMRRQLGGIAMPDTTAALGQGGAGTSRFDLRLQPTLVLLNGRRLVSAPMMGANGTDYVDVNQIPLQLLERVEITNGLAAALYGEGAMGGAVNFVTRRDLQGFDVELGGQVVDTFDQGEGDIALTYGIGDQDTGMNLMVSYFNRQPLAASDQEWIGERTDRVESLLGNPATFQQFSNFDYPISDPSCDLAQGVGHSEGYEVRLRGYGPPSNLSQLTPELQMRFLDGYDRARGLPETMNNMSIDALESPTYCAGDFTGNNDLILKEERIQTYTTFWHKLSEHTEAIGEFGYYRSDNSNRTAPAFPLNRLSSTVSDPQPLWVPRDHFDQPVQQYGFSAVDTMAADQRVPNDLFIVGRTQGNFNGDGVNERRLDVWRGVLGLHGDLSGVAPTGPVSSWDWDVSGTYSASDLTARVQDTLMDNLKDALASCPSETLDPDSLEMVPTTIKQRQDLGCFNPFYSSTINNAALDPLNVSNASAQASAAGFITSDSDARETLGFGAQDGGYICDPSDASSPACPASFDRDGDGVFELAGTPNTQQVIDHITGQHFEYQKRTLAVVDAGLRGNIAEFGTSALAFGVGAQYRRESLLIDYDQAYNDRQYGFLFGADDLEPVTRDVVAGTAELRLSVANGLLEVQPAVRVEAYDTVGAGLNGLLGVAVRPFANSDAPALEWLGVRGHIGRGQQAPSLLQLYGQQNEFVQVDYRGGTQFVPHQISGNPSLDFETYTTISAGPMWEYAGVHVGADFWLTTIDDVVGADNARTLVSDCWEQYQAGIEKCHELALIASSEILDHLESNFDNIAEVDTNGIDGSIGYTLDSKRRGLGDFGTFVLGVQGSFINSYLIKSPRVLASYYRDGAPVVVGTGEYASPVFNADGTRNYNGLTAEYEAAGYRNYENFAPPIPKLRFSVPVRWMYSGHTIGATVRFIDGYNDDSEYTIEKRNLPGIDQIQYAEGESIPSWMVLDAMYAFAFGDPETWQGKLSVGMINVLDTAPPAVESPLGYEVGVHDPRGRAIYARVSGDF